MLCAFHWLCKWRWYEGFPWAEAGTDHVNELVHVTQNYTCLHLEHGAQAVCQLQMEVVRRRGRFGLYCRCFAHTKGIHKNTCVHTCMCTLVLNTTPTCRRANKMHTHTSYPKLLNTPTYTHACTSCRSCVKTGCCGSSSTQHEGHKTGMTP
jgi:hypothetical protein